jgi:hypothetical protein
MKNLVAVVFAMMLAGSAHAVSPPKPTTSEYLRSTGAGFAMSPEEGVRYGMNFAVLKAVEAPIYVTVLFESPEKGRAPLREEQVLEVGSTELAVQSERLRLLRNNKKYTVQVRLYADEARSQLLGVHKQKVLFSVPNNFVSQLEGQFGIRIE